MLMIIVALLVLGLALGSFVNALVWRLHEQEQLRQKTKGKKAAKPSGHTAQDLSITRGRSMCPHCHHELAVKDLVPVFSWLILRGKCRYCGKPIATQYPLVELGVAALFVASYLLWPSSLIVGKPSCPSPHLFSGANFHSNLLFILWIIFLTGLIALLVYDLRWFLLPDRIIFPLYAVAGLIALITIANSPEPLKALLNTVLAVAIGGGIFYVLFQASKGKWIGGGDVKLGWLLGLVAGTPGRAILLIFLASVIGTLVSLPLLATHRLKRNSVIPFGPFLIIGAIIVQLFGHSILHWYQTTFFPFI